MQDLYIGIDLGGTNIAAGVVTVEGKILHTHSVPTGAQRHYTEIIKDMADAAITAVSEAGIDMAEIKSVGIGSPGTCDNVKGELVYTNNINFKHVPMRTEMQKYIDKPIYIENDANCAALGEYAAMKKDMKCFLAVTLGTGVGFGIIIDGKIHPGFNGAGGEGGHIVIIKDGEPCTCGRRGCLEAYASATALINQTKIAIAKNPDSLMAEMTGGCLSNVTGRTACDAAKQGDPAANAVVKEYIDYVALGITNFVNIFQPEVLVIGGGVSKEGDYLLTPIKEFVSRESYDRDVTPTEIRIAMLGNNAGIIGAALLGK